MKSTASRRQKRRVLDEQDDQVGESGCEGDSQYDEDDGLQALPKPHEFVRLLLLCGLEQIEFVLDRKRRKVFVPELQHQPTSLGITEADREFLQYFRRRVGKPGLLPER